jgi:hypothetical protein
VIKLGFDDILVASFAIPASNYTQRLDEALSRDNFI